MARYQGGYRGERRTAHFGLQLTPSERAFLEKQAKRRGMGVAEYVREKCFKRPDKEPEVKRDPVSKELIHEFRALGNNLNQLARIANINGEIRREGDLDQTLKAVRAAIAKVLAL
jgi:hypothetical protein